MPQDKWTRYQN